MDLFKVIRIETPESTELEFILAGIGNRVYALIIDYIILNLSLLALLIVPSFLLYFFSLETVFSGFDDGQYQWVIAIVALILYGLYVGYFVGFETLWQGQTPGKRRAKIRVIRDNAQPIGLFQATLRALLRPVDDILFVGFLFILFGKREKRLGDWLASTLVVQLEQAPEGENPQISEQASSLMTQLLSEVDFSKMLPDDFAIIKEYLQRRSRLAKPARAKLSIQLAQNVQDTLGMEPRPWEVTADVFLEAIYLSYQRQFRSS
ncbi:MAG: RDD family protein [Cyanobacteria bacterium P01_F01_bin.150]